MATQSPTRPEQVTAEGWFVAHPDLTVAETRRLRRIGQAVEQFLDMIG